MTGQMTKYKESLRHMPEPIMLSQIQKKVDLRGLMNYAKEKGIKVYKSLVGHYMTSIEMAGFSISLLKLDEELKTLLDAKADTVGFKAL